VSARPKIRRVLLNDIPVQEEYTLPGPTLGHLPIPEAARNPILIQGDHAAVAIRNIYIRENPREKRD
jgi:hypothetical protein